MTQQTPISITVGPKGENKVPPRAALSLLNDDDDDEEEEEMPPEAKLRMKNVGKNTPKSFGPNSFSTGPSRFIDKN